VDELDVREARNGLALALAAEAQTFVEGERRRVGRRRADTDAPPLRLCQRVADQRRPDSATKRRRRDEQPRDEQLVVVALEPDRAQQLAVLLAQPQLLAARLQLRDRLVRGRQRRIADQLRLDRVRSVLDGKDVRAERLVRQVRPTPGSTCGGRRRRDP